MIPSPLLPLLPSSHTSTSSSKPHQHRRPSGDKSGTVHRASSTPSLHKSASSKNNGAPSKSGRLHYHPHVAHTSASKHHRTTSFGHRVPSYGKQLNKLTALTTDNAVSAPKEHLTVHSTVRKAGSTGMRRSYSEGSGTSYPAQNVIGLALSKKERRRSSGSTSALRPKDKWPTSQPYALTAATKPKQQHVTFSTKHFSDDDDDDTTLVHRKSSDVVESPHHLRSISPTQTTVPYRHPATKFGLKEVLSPSSYKFLPKNLIQMALDPPKVSMTNAVSKDLTKLSASMEQASSDIARSNTPFFELQVTSPSNRLSHFISTTPPSRTARTPESDVAGLRRNRSNPSLSIEHTIPLTTQSQVKLTRTQQKLLLQRASTQSLNLSTTYSSPSLNTSVSLEQRGDYFSPLSATSQTQLPPGFPINIPYDVKVAREYDRISRELNNVRRFGDPTADALERLRSRTVPSATKRADSIKKQSTFGLYTWRRSPDKLGVQRVSEENEVFTGERKSKVEELMRRLWFDEIDVAELSGLEEEEEVAAGRRNQRARLW